ncbi:hypothetical protein ACFX19_041874 [Malus domestica]
MKKTHGILLELHGIVIENDGLCPICMTAGRVASEDSTARTWASGRRSGQGASNAPCGSVLAGVGSRFGLGHRRLRAWWLAALHGAQARVRLEP